MKRRHLARLAAFLPRGGQTMGLQRLLGRLAIAALAVSASLHATANPLTDSDNDGVFDEEPDYCPTTPGSRLNGGCPAGEELVVVYGYPDPFVALGWFADFVHCPDGTLQLWYEDCGDYGLWGDYFVSLMIAGDHARTDKRHDGAGTPCGGDPAKPNSGIGCVCGDDETRAEVEAGFFCRPSCPSGQTWADGLAHGSLYEGGGTCAVESCVNDRDGYTRLEARPTLGCFPDMKRDYIENVVEPYILPTACYMLVGAGGSVACWLSGAVAPAVLCSAAASLVAGAIDACPGYPWTDEDDEGEDE